MKLNCKRVIHLTYLLLFTPVIIFAQSELEDYRAENKIPLDTSVHVGKLNNGLTYYIKRNIEPKDRAELYLVIKAGSLQEEDDQKGLAHFTEHMAFNGTQSYPKNELINYLEKAGIRFGADLNAYTTFDHTVYQLPIYTNDNELLEDGIEILSEWANKVSFDFKEIDAERGVIIEEERQRGKNANERMSKKLLPVLLANSRFKDRLPIGDMNVIKTFEHSRLTSYYKKWYRTDLQSVIVVGDVNPKDVESLIGKYFNPIKKSTHPLEIKNYSIEDNNSPMVAIALDPEFSYTVATLNIKNSSSPLITNNDLRKSLVNSLINTMLASRISEEVKDGKATYLQAGIAYGPYQGGLGNIDAFSIQVVAKSAESLQQSIYGVMDNVESVSQFGFIEAELERAKIELFSSIDKSYKESNKTSSKAYVNQLVKHFVFNESYMDIKYLFHFYQWVISQISLDEVNKQYKSFIRDDNWVLTLQGSSNDEKVLPNEVELVNWFSNNSREVKQYKDQVSSLMTILDEKPMGGKLISKRADSNLGTTELTLGNGIKIIIKITDFKNDEIRFTSFSPGGTSLANKEVLESAKLATTLISSSGVADFSSSNLQKVLTGKSLSFQPYISTYYEGFKGYASPKDFESLLQLIYLYTKYPRKDSVTFNRLIEQYEINVKAKETNPIAIFQDTINMVLQGNSKWIRSSSLEDIATINLDSAFHFYQERFADLSDMTFVFVGNIDEKEMIPILVTYLGGLPSFGRKENYNDVGISPLKGHINKTVYKGMDEKATVVLAYHNNYHFNHSDNLYLEAFKSILDTRLIERLRENEGGVYSPSVQLSRTKIPESYFMLSINFTCQPQRADELIMATNEEINQLLNEGPTPEELDTFITQKLHQFEKNIRSNNYWLNSLTALERDELYPEHVLKYDQFVKKMKPDRLKKVLKKLFKNRSEARLVLYPNE